MKRFFLISAVLICLAALIFMTGCPQAAGGGSAGGVFGGGVAVVQPSTDTSLKTFKLFTGEVIGGIVDVNLSAAAGEGWNGGSVKTSAAVFLLSPIILMQKYILRVPFKIPTIKQNSKKI